MGEHIKNLDVIKLKGQTIRIELNKNDVEDLEYDIHLEAPYFRYNMSSTVFLIPTKISKQVDSISKKHLQ